MNRNYYFIIWMLIFVPNSCKYFKENPQCASLYSAPKSQGISFLIRDQDFYGDLSDDTRIFESGWSVTGSIVVELGCEINVCNETYLDGNCHKLEYGSHSVEENGFIDGTASAQCICEKECDCTDIHISKRSCGRAYFEDGCRKCNALYMELELSNIYFPEEFKNKVKAIVLRKGCTITLFPEEDFEGVPFTIDQEISQDFQGEIGSYDCTCNDTIYEPRPPTARTSSAPELINIPYSISELDEMLRNFTFKHHYGLNAAHRSYRNGRSTRSAYILILGSSGAGKSTAINLLLDKPKLAKVYESVSTTNGIHEFRIPVAVNELGIANAELRVIEALGFGDTRGLVQDAKGLAILDNYLASHEDLKDRIPNVVLIFHKFNDNRFAENGSRFIKMVQGFGTFRKRITDKKYSNVIFVLSNFCSATKSMQRQPGDRIKQYKKVIQDQNVFPRPTHIVVAENKGELQWLSMSNGYFKLPNNENYPGNLIERMKFVTKKGGDMIGFGVINSVFNNLENTNVSSVPEFSHFESPGMVQVYISKLGQLGRVNYGGHQDKAEGELELVARIERLETLLEKEKVARAENLERFKRNFVAEQLTFLRNWIQGSVEEIRMEIWNKIKVDLNKLFE